MWYPSTVTAAPTTEPVTLDEVKKQCLVDSTDDDALLARLIKAARSHVEKYCNARWAEQALACQCDSFADFGRLSEGPLKSVTSITYVDAAGQTQTLDAAVIDGENTADPWYGHYSGGPVGNLASAPMNGVRASVPDLEYQNFAQGGSTWAGALEKIEAIAAVGANAVLAACGVNDVAAARTWDDIKSDMDNFRAGLPGGTKLFICEVTPWTVGNDTQAADIRSLNANYAAWCDDNGATLIRTHDAMAQIRASTGELDDQKTAYNYDGVHLTADGVTALAALLADGLSAALWLPEGVKQSDSKEGTWTPAIAASSGAITSVTGASGQYTKIGNRVFFDLAFNIVTNGTGAGFITATLPFPNGAVNFVAMGAINSGGSEALYGVAAGGGTQIFINTAAGAYPGADGRSYTMSGCYAVS